MRDLEKLSILVPMFNEEEVLSIFFSRYTQFLDELGCMYEIICVDDGSSDNTLGLLKKYAQTADNVKIISLSRNFGKESAMTAGLDYCTGDAVVPVDVDLQDPPEVIREFLAKWKEGYDVVYGIRRQRSGEGVVKKITAYAFYRLFNVVSENRIPADTGDFRLMDRKVVDAVKLLPERNRFMKGLYSWVGFKQVGVLYDRDARAAGTGKWGLFKLWNFAIEGVTSFSSVPLKVWSYLGILVSSVSIIYAVWLSLRTFFVGADVPGYASLFCAVAFLGGIQLISLGVLGEYLARTYIEVKQRPNFIVKELIGLKSPV